MLSLAAFFISLLLVAFGEPTTSSFFSKIAAFVGFVPLFYLLTAYPARKRFFIGWLFFTLVSLIQLFWLTSHPYAYIYAVWILLSLLMGLQFGLLSLLVTKERLLSFPTLLAIPALWTLLEMSRLFWLTGFTFAPTGLCLAQYRSFTQIASYCGISGLSFLVLLYNSLITSLLLKYRTGALLVTFFLIGSVATIGFLHEKKEIPSPLFTSLIVETRLLPEELNIKELQIQAFTTWKELIAVLLPYKGEKLDLVLLPEIVVPFGADAALFPGAEIQALLLPLDPTLQLEPQVSSRQITQTLASLFEVPFLIGLEAIEFRLKRSYFNSGFFIRPNTTREERYDKQLLLPMAEEIPAEWLKPLAAQYGLFDSFQRGKGVVLFKSNNQTLSTSICYEDTFPRIMREHAAKGATLLTNLTNDGWYPNSNLGSAHFELARLRAVENGRPL
jgi:apolipoprotein N-acyltransferase